MEPASFSPPQIKKHYQVMNANISSYSPPPKSSTLKLFFVVEIVFCLGFSREASLEKDVFDALMLVKNLGPDVLELGRKAESIQLHWELVARGRI
ncbi:hypothetical protein OIU77_026127 [Salix suchowensis]|uniref:Uncharacterized protein n=1 Tax=Salix suchowensis TaxID=1278906 RepID=A0ABQ9C272_9ROSI|nr:hypothetical protein OIU77_026127 [Salix suchowensis]KAJ6392310.1 hypothetical protein OIU77_026127 [Salix suchowensis]KAJ6392311.1 hypothetical protein OIU77_026127 [Salix suchowensis]